MLNVSAHQANFITYLVVHIITMFYELVSLFLILLGQIQAHHFLCTFFFKLTFWWLLKVENKSKKPLLLSFPLDIAYITFKSVIAFLRTDVLTSSPFQVPPLNPIRIWAMLVLSPSRNVVSSSDNCRRCINFFCRIDSHCPRPPLRRTEETCVCVL